MSVTIRLRRVGRKKQPYYRVVVTDSRNAREGKYLEALGHYTSISKPAELRLDLARVDAWLGQGARLSDTVRTLVNKARKGGDASVRYVATTAAAESAAAAAEAAPAASVGSGVVESGAAAAE